MILSILSTIFIAQLFLVFNYNYWGKIIKNKLYQSFISEYKDCIKDEGIFVATFLMSLIILLVNIVLLLIISIIVLVLYWLIVEMGIFVVIPMAASMLLFGLSAFHKDKK